MNTVYYTMTYSEYKKHCHRLPNCVGHSVDEELTDESPVVLKVHGEDHVHHYLEQQEKVTSYGSGQYSDAVKALDEFHPVMRVRV